MAADASGNIFIADTFNHRIRRVAPDTSVIATVAGDGFTQFSGDNGFAHGASLSQPEGITRDSSGNLFIADTSNHRIRRVDGITGIITTAAGSGVNGYAGDTGAATEAQLSWPEAVVADAAGNLYIADTFNNRVRFLDTSTGIITTVAGNGDFSFSGDGGLATEAALADPSGLALDSDGNLYVADKTNHRVRFINTTTGIITTVAGDGATEFSGDDGPATEASLYNPKGVALDPSGNLLIADTWNNVIRQVTPEGTITTIAGNGERDFDGDGGAATLAALADPAGVAVDESGNIFIADSFNDRIRRVDAVTGLIATLAGSGRYGFSSDNVPATEAALADPGALLVDATGNVYIADSTNDRIRGVRGSTPTPPTEGCGTITPGQTLTGSLEATDRFSSNRSGVFADCYTFEGTLGDRVAIEMNSTEIDPYLFLMSNVGRIIEFDDDGGEGLNAAIPSSGSLILPASGTYVVEATSFSDSAAGSYTLTLSVTADTPLECSPIAFGETIEGGLTGSDAGSDHRQSYGDCYTFSAAEGDRVAVTLASTDFDTYLYLVNPAGRLIASNDDRSEDSNSRIPDSGSLALSDGGVHTIEVAAYTSSGSGAYSLSLARASDSTALTCSTIALGQTVSGTLDLGDGGSRNRSGSRADCYTFSGEAGSRLTFAMDSLDFDTFLFLMDAESEVIDSNDDGPAGTDSRMTVTLPTTREYTLEATSWSETGEGTYTLSVTREAISTSLTCSTISLGQAVSGELAATDGTSSNRLGSQADCYAFAAPSDERITVSLSSDDFDAYLYIQDASGEVLDFNDDDGRGTDSRISGFSVSASTTYTFEATSWGEGATGAYTISLSQVSLAPSTDCSPITVGDAVTGVLEESDAESRNRSESRADCYTFSGTAGDRVDISLTSDDFDTYLYLLNADGDVVADDDDGGDGVNSRITSLELPSTETFVIEATSFSGSSTGNYTLVLTRFESATCTPISYGETVTGTLGLFDDESRNQTDSRADCYTFSAVEGDRISVSLSSDDFDTYVFLSDALGDVVASDDDGGDGINSRIVSFPAPSTGTFTIEATSYFGGTGTYSLTLTRTETADCTTLVYGQTIEGSLASGDSASVFRTGSNADCYTFSATADDAIVISMSSDDFDTYLYLIDPSGQELTSNDDGGDGTNSRIPGSGTTTIPATGDYSIEATSFFSGETGAYSLTLQRIDALSLVITESSPNLKAEPGRVPGLLKARSDEPVKKRRAPK